MSKILHLIPTLEGGGAERQLSMLAVQQIKHGWDVHVALRRIGVHADAMRQSGIIIHYLGDFKGLHPALIRRVSTLADRIRPHILHTWLPQMDIIGGLVACWNRLRWVLSERASQEAYQSMTILAFLRCRLARYASAVVANSGDGALYWRHTLPAGTTVTTIPNAVDVAAVRDSCPSTHDDFGNDGPRFLFVGRLVPQKAPEVFVQSLALMPTSRPLYGLIIGEGPMRHDIQANIQFHGLSSRIRVLPYQENWWGLLKTTTALVSPSRFEGQPNVVLEAMAAECPLIVSDIRPHRSILDERSAVFVPKDDPRALADALLAFLEDPQGARQRVERAHAQVTRFTVDVTAEAYETVYTRVLAGRSS